MPVDPTVRILDAATVAVDDGDDLGEGPFWDGASGRLLWVDIKGGLLHSWAQHKAKTTRRFGGMLGFAIPRRGGGLVAGLDRRLVVVDPDGGEFTLAEVEGGLADNRFNDAKCDRAGRLFAGTMSIRREPGVASLYRLEPGGHPEPVLDGLTISNGLGWSPDDRRMYVIDSTTQRIDVFDYEIRSGQLGKRRPFTEIDATDGLPDGLTVDAAGGVWVALFGGAEVRRYDPAGRLDLRICLPTDNCTCPAFGGPDLGDLYITTARHRLGRAELASQPHAGAVFHARPGWRGMPGNLYAG